MNVSSGAVDQCGVTGRGVRGPEGSQNVFSKRVSGVRRNSRPHGRPPCFVLSLLSPIATATSTAATSSSSSRSSSSSSSSSSGFLLFLFLTFARGLLIFDLCRTLLLASRLRLLPFVITYLLCFAQKIVYFMSHEPQRLQCQPQCTPRVFQVLPST